MVLLVVVPWVSTIMDLYYIGRGSLLESLHTEHGYAYIGDDIYIYILFDVCLQISTNSLFMASITILIKYFGHWFLFWTHTLGGICYTPKCCSYEVSQLSVVIVVNTSISLHCCTDNCHTHPSAFRAQLEFYCHTPKCHTWSVFFHH